ncbi:MAG: hypothetical protein ABIH42_10165 [Planctomycetota bacterium]
MRKKEIQKKQKYSAFPLRLYRKSRTITIVKIESLIQYKVIFIIIGMINSFPLKGAPYA